MRRYLHYGEDSAVFVQVGGIVTPIVEFAARLSKVHPPCNTFRSELSSLRHTFRSELPRLLFPKGVDEENLWCQGQSDEDVHAVAEGDGVGTADGITRVGGEAWRRIG